MSSYSRREFGKVVFAGVPLAAVVGTTRLWAEHEVALGATTYSFRDLFRVPGRDNVDDVIRAIQASGVTRIELASVNVEPAGPNTGPAAPPKPAAYPRNVVVLSPEQAAHAKAAVRAGLREWRLRTEPAHFEQVRARFTAAGITIHAYAVEYDAEFTDAEIDATFRQARSLGAAAISSPVTMEMAARLVPFAERHEMSVAIHNQADGNAANLIGTANLGAALALSPSLTVKLDIGHATASNRDAVADVRTYEARLSHVQVQDRRRNGGRSERLGEGDTPIAGVLAVLKSSSRSIPALVEYDYVGQGTSVEEVSQSVAFLAKALK